MGATQRNCRDIAMTVHGPAIPHGVTNQQGPLIVMIDELDRCRPSFAVEFLETTKHLFAVDQVVFVLAVNRKELAHAVKALYGNDFDADRYLRRFFDIDFRLPEPVRGRENYIDVLLDSTEIEDPVVRNSGYL